MNNFVEWSDALSVGIEELDVQHRGLVALLNQLNDAIDHHHGNAAVGAILAQLDEYTRVHFAVEESLMRLLGYPQIDAHKREHERLTEQLAEFRGRFDAGKTALGFELMHFLKLWLTNHIMTSDQGYARFFSESGAGSRIKRRGWRARLLGR
jgi:hemerythrin